jgi:5-methylthioribose kinase
VQSVKDTWNSFSARFVELWHQEGTGGGLFASEIFKSDAVSYVAAQNAFMRELLRDALLFGGCVMIRRLVGIAHNADFERIEDVDVKAICEGRALALGRELLVNCSAYGTIEAVVDEAVSIRNDGRVPCFPFLHASRAGTHPAAVLGVNGKQ